MTQAIAPVDQNTLASSGEALAGMIEAFRQFKIETAEHYAWACAQLLAVKTQIKTFEAQKKQATKPMNDALAAVRAWFRPVETPLATIETLLKERIGSYETAERAKQQQAMQTAAQAFQQGQHEQGLVLLQAVPEQAVVKQQGVSARAVVKFRITDPALVPREYCEPVEKLIRARVALSGLATQIPGVEVFEDRQVTVRTG